MAEEKGYYLEEFRQLEETHRVPGRLQKLRREAWDRFVSLSFPTTHDEEWRFTNIGPITKTAFRASWKPQSNLPMASDLKPLLFDEEARLVFVNGRYAEGLSSLPSSNLQIRNLQQSPGYSETLENHLAHYAEWKKNIFTAWNTAFLLDGAVVEIPAGTVLEKPVHLLFLTTGKREAMFHPRVLILSGRTSQATVVESHVNLSNNRYLSNAVTEVILEEGAVLHHLKVQREGPAGFHIATIQVEQKRDSSYSSFLLSLGGELSRTDLNVRLNGAGADCKLNGLYLLSGNQHTDHHTIIDHLQPNGTSLELYKGILGDQSRGVFNGRIIVRKDAQKTSARQTNQNLLLSDGARINTKPQLEILADDVKCNHGATIGHLDEDTLFYLRSRGMSDSSARALLMYGFVNDVSGRIALETIRAKIDRLLVDRLHQLAADKEAA